MKPKPFSALNHFTVPLAMPVSFERTRIGSRTMRNPEVIALVRRGVEQQKRPRLRSRANGTSEPRLLVTTLHRMVRLGHAVPVIATRCPDVPHPDPGLRQPGASPRPAGTARARK